MTNQEILDNAPEGATHYDSYEYMRHIHDGVWEYWSKAVGWEETVPESDTRSLADIKRIAELEKTCKSRSDTIIEYSIKIAELEKERIKMLSCFLDISDECIGEITMNYRVGSEYIGGRIQAATGMTHQQLWDAVKEQE